MRTGYRLGVALSVGWLVACAGEPGTDSATLGVPERDLTLQRPAPEVAQVASPFELAMSRPEAKTPRQPRPVAKPALAPKTPERPEASPAPEPVAVPIPAVGQPSEPVAEAQTAKSDRELAPGETVTVIPASTGPSPGPEEEVGMPPARASRGIFIGGGGGTCRPRRGGGVRGLGRPLAGRLHF